MDDSLSAGSPAVAYERKCRAGWPLHQREETLAVPESRPDRAAPAAVPA